MLLAGLDGIKNKITPGDADERNLYELSEKELQKTPSSGQISSCSSWKS